VLFKVTVQNFFARVGPCTNRARKLLLEFHLKLFCMVRYRVQMPLARTSANRYMILSVGELTENFDSGQKILHVCHKSHRIIGKMEFVPLFIGELNSKIPQNVQ
jgi:hypothetical protein